MKFNDIDLENLFKLMKANGITECNLREDNFQIEIKIAPAQLKQSISDSTKIYRSEKEILDEDENKTSVIHEIKTPLVGTFYRASSPESESFVEIGDHVNINDTLCIIEAMKSLNEIKADIKGVIKDIPVNNGDLVEYDQILFLIQPE